MKKELILFLILLITCCNISKPADMNIPGSLADKQKIYPAKKIRITSPFQGQKIFCSTDSDARYSVTIKGNNVVIYIDNKRITGVYRKDKLFTNDPEEIEYRKFAPKNNYGKFYVIATDYFSVLNPENSEYRYFTVCK